MKKEELNKEVIKFNLEKLRGKKVAVHCVTEEQFKNFVNWVNSLGEALYRDNYWEHYGEGSCLTLWSNLSWGYDDKYFYKEEGYEIISYEEALLKESKIEPKNSIEEEKMKTNKEEEKEVEFNLEKLRGKYICVNCKTEAEAQNFVTWGNSLEEGDGCYNTLWNEYKEDTCYAISEDLLWSYLSKVYAEEQDYEMISYEEALTKESLLKVSEQKDKKINNLHKMLAKKDSKIENQAKEISELLKINKELKEGVTRDLNNENKVNEKVNKVSHMYEGQLKVHENEIKRLHTIIHYLEEKCLKVYED